jgi:hypothetical protein
VLGVGTLKVPSGLRCASLAQVITTFHEQHSRHQLHYCSQSGSRGQQRHPGDRVPLLTCCLLGRFRRDYGRGGTVDESVYGRFSAFIAVRFEGRRIGKPFRIALYLAEEYVWGSLDPPDPHFNGDRGKRIV